MPQPSRRLLLLTALVASLSACGGGGDEAAAPAPAPAPTPSPAPAPAPAPAPTPAPAPAPAVVGLDARPANASCRAPARASATSDLTATRAFPALSFGTLTGLLQAPGNASRWYVLEQAGVIRSFANDDAATTSTVFANLTARVTTGFEAGLLGVAFHPRYPADPRVFVSYSTGGSSLVSRVSSFRTSDGGATLDLSTEQVLLTVAQPEDNHNGGHIAFGPDGFLYIGFGDGGGGGDVHGAIGNGQLLSTLLGKILRIDIDSAPSGATYAIPASNPFAGGASCAVGGTTAAGNRCAEIYAFGLRNPWRFSFDRANGTLWAADVGQGAWEEIDRVTLGGNFGWRCREGAHAFNASCGGATDLIEPVAEYGHSAGSSITGGYVYRGTALPSLVGRYVFGDFGSGSLWSIPSDTAPTLTLTVGASSGLQLTAFGEGVDGELYAVTYNGTIHRIGLASNTPATVATQLSATGCATAGAPATPVAGMIPYAPVAPFWSDGAVKERYLALPDATAIGVDGAGDFDLPAGSVLVKHFRLGARLVETRLFMRHPDGVWAGYTYEWNASGTDATRVIGGKTATIGAQTWTFPSEAQCLQCHTAAAGRSLGLEIPQLNTALRYPATGRTANQLTTLNAIGLLSPALAQEPATLPKRVDPYGTEGTLAERARSYLHTNCSNCHRPGGGTPDGMDLRYTTPLAQTQACLAPIAGDLGIANARRLAPGSAASSVIVARMNRRGAAQMPPIGSLAVDTAGVALVSDWIASLGSCN